MPAWILIMLTYLSLAAEAEPLIEQLLGGIGQLVALLSRHRWGDAATPGLSASLQQAEGLVRSVDAGSINTDKWLVTMWPDIEALLQAFPGLSASLYARHNLMADQHIGHSMAAKVVESAHANVRIARQVTP